MKHLFIFFCILFSGLSSCKLVNHNKQVRNFNFHFGSFGGFTGETDEYILYGNGILCHVRAFSKDTIFIKQIENKELRIIFKLADSKRLKNIHLELEGNMNYFVKFYKKTTLIEAYRWTDGSKVPEELNKLYSLLNNLIKIEK